MSTKAFEETGTDLHTNHEDEKDESEILREIEDGCGSRESDVSCDDAGKKYKCDAQRDARNLDFTQIDTHGYDDGVEQHDVGYGVRRNKQFF